MSAAKLALLAALAAVAHAADDDTIGFGPAFSLGPTQSWIREANTTIVLPAVPSPQVDRLALWAGMGTSGGDLIQALAVSFTDPGANCDGATSGQWCIWASTLQDTQLGGKMVPADAGDSVTMHCRFSCTAAAGTWPGGLPSQAGDRLFADFCLSGRRLQRRHEQVRPDRLSQRQAGFYPVDQLRPGPRLGDGGRVPGPGLYRHCSCPQ